MTTLRTGPRGPVTSEPLQAPPAVRAGSPGWRDPRLVLGVGIVAVCVLLGARLFAAADDTVAVWRLRHDVAAGAGLSRGDLVVAQVHFAGSGSESYLTATTDLAEGSVAVHDLAAGELLARSAVAVADGRSLVEVPISVAPDDLPASVVRGATVDVWVTPAAPGGTDPRRARLALDDVVVVEVPDRADSLAPESTRQVIVGVDEADADLLPDALGDLADGRVVVTRQAGP